MDHIKFREDLNDMKENAYDNALGGDMVILEILMKRRGWRSKLTEKVPGSRIDLLAIFPSRESIAFTSQLVSRLSRDVLEDFLSSLKNICQYSLFTLDEEIFLVSTIEQQKNYTPEFITAGAYPLFFPIVEEGIGRWLLAVKDPSKVFHILLDNNEVLTVRRIPSFRIADIIKNYIEKREVFFSIPKLTKKQKQILKYSLRAGFYEYPKQVRIKDMAKIFRLPSSTICYNLRVAEKKILQWFIDIIES
ncbi:MAG: helix-turn-helix domain-containing protein [Desulfurococcales archaeon]|nr:helix-turn-helix domain-containing protein [Desulfurococcales archaeon]